jgi:phosphoglucosamine mutase
MMYMFMMRASYPHQQFARSVLDQHADLGIAITASHNPSCDNGIKLFDHCAHKLDDAQESLIESLIDTEPEPHCKLAYS